jgi:hypothetical protein
MRIEIRQFCSDATMEHLLAVTPLDVGFATAARRQEHGQNPGPSPAEEASGGPGNHPGERSDTEIPRYMAASAGEWQTRIHSLALAATAPNERGENLMSKH